MTPAELFAFVVAFAGNAGILIALIAALSFVEAVAPYHRSAGGWRRVQANIGLIAIYFTLNLALTLLTLGVVAAAQHGKFGLLAGLAPPFPAFLVIGLVALDFFSYIAHVCMHKFSVLWRVHRVHHSDVHVDATTAFRQHPFEGIWRFAFTLAPALALGLPAEVVAIYRLASGLNAIFEHANIRLWPPLDRLLSLLVVTPNFHKVHHSRRRAETDSNYGNIFTLFDRMFGTLKPAIPARDVNYGLDDFSGEDSLVRQLGLPFREPRS